MSEWGWEDPPSARRRGHDSSTGGSHPEDNFTTGEPTRSKPASIQSKPRSPGSEATATPAKPTTTAAKSASGPRLTGAPSGLFRRRRIAAALVVLGLVALLVGALGSGGASHSTKPAKPSLAHATSPRLTPAQTRALVDKEQEKAIDWFSPTPRRWCREASRATRWRSPSTTAPGPTRRSSSRTLISLHVPATFFAIGVDGALVLARHPRELPRRRRRRRPHADAPVPGPAHPARPAPTAARPGGGRSQEQGLPVPRLFRPPYGSFNAATLHELRQLHMLMVLWSTDTSTSRCPACARSCSARSPGHIPARSSSCTTPAATAARRSPPCPRSSAACGAAA